MAAEHGARGMFSGTNSALQGSRDGRSEVDLRRLLLALGSLVEVALCTPAMPVKNIHGIVRVSLFRVATASL